MENSQSTKKRSSSKGGSITIMTGILITFIACISLAGGAALDTVGEKTTGKVSNVSKNCPPGKSCWTGKVEFTTKKNEKIAFYPMSFPLLFDFDPWLSGRSYEEYGDYQVRYFESFPQLAKIKFAFFLEYINSVCGLGIGLIVLLIGYLSSRPNKPIVLDFSKRK
jgi:hypothetical protein